MYAGPLSNSFIFWANQQQFNIFSDKYCQQFNIKEDDRNSLPIEDITCSQCCNADTPKSGVDNNLQKKEKVLDSGKQQVDSEDASNSTLNLESFGSKVPENHSSRLGASNFRPLLSKQTSFPKLGHMFVDALKKNRSCQRFLRSKLIELEARLEENKKLKERVKILKDFQVSCRRRMGRALSQKKDARVQLISLPKLKASKNSKVIP